MSALLGVFAWLVPLAYPRLPQFAHLDATLVTTVVAIGVASNIILLALDRSRRIDPGSDVLAVDAWLGVNLALLVAIVAPADSVDLFYLLPVTVVPIAAIHAPPGQATWAVSLLAGYLVVAQAMGRLPPANDLVVPLQVYATTTVLSGVVSSALRRETRAHARAARTSAIHAELLANVSSAARAMSRLDPNAVLDEVTAAIARLGYEVAGVAVADPASGTYHYAAARGLPDDVAAGRHAIDGSISGLALLHRRSIVAEDHDEDDGTLHLLRALGLQVAVSTPIWSRGDVTAALTGATTRPHEVAPEEIAAFELLASHAGRALENAEAFEEQRHAVQRLTELDQMKGDFLSTVSHELRTPLTVVRGLLETLDVRWEHLDDAVRRDLVLRAGANAVALDDVITALLDFARLEAGTIRVAPATIDVTAMIEGVVHRLETLLNGHTVTLNGSGPVVACGDPVLIERVIENLLSNAVKYTPAGSRVTVQVMALSDDVVEIAVTDDGPGIDGAALAHLGERFFRVADPNTRSARGVGLGLAFCREVLRLHDSELLIHSAVGRGSRFAFRLALATTEPAEVEPQHA